MRSGPAVDGKLVETGKTALFQGGEVEKGVFDRPLDLVGVVPGEEHEGRVGLDPLNPGGPRVIGLRAPHEIQHFFLLGRASASWCRHTARPRAREATA